MELRSKHLFPFLAALALLPACSLLSSGRGIDIRGMAPGGDPGVDFYRYANGRWLDTHPIPPEYSAWGTGHEVRERNQKLLHKILEDAADHPGHKGAEKQQLGDFYASGMDVKRIEAAGAAPLHDLLESIEAIPSVAALPGALAGLHAMGVSAVFEVGVEPDFEDSSVNLAYMGQGGLGLPDRDYYTREGADAGMLREQYVEHVARMFELLGNGKGQAGALAATVMDMETRMAQSSYTNVQMRDVELFANKVTLEEAGGLTSRFSWPAYLSAAGAPPIEVMNLTNPGFFQEVDRMLEEVPLEDWKTYLRWHLVHAAAGALSSDFENEDFRFFGTILSGTEELQPRWKRVLAAVSGSMGEALGHLYVERAFSPEAKARAEGMVRNLLAAMRESLEGLDWMSYETRQEALRKLAAFRYKIGYPDEWRDYSSLEIDRDSFALNQLHAATFEFHHQIAKLGQPVDRNEWGMYPQMVNAYYNPLLNEIVFPAGILQPPFFSDGFDDAVNYGGIGSVIGHEITHGFDDQGSRFDAEGKKRDWWSESDQEEFDRRAQVLRKQFDGYVAIDDLHVNGQLTLGENIADLGGVRIAYEALEKALEGQPRRKIAGFTPEQRFFLAYAQLWRRNARPEALRLQVNTNPHSPARFRAIGPIGNMQAFADAFGLDESAPMVRPASERARIW